MKPERKRRLVAFGLVLLALVHVALVIGMQSRAFDAFFNDANHRLGPGTDFAAYYVAARAWLAGQGAYGHGPAFGFRYHPLFAMVIGETLARLPMRVAFLAWVVINEVLLLGTLLVLRRRSDDSRCATAVTLLMLFFSPYFLETYMGNASFVVAALLLLAFDAVDRGKPWPGMALFLVSLLIKPLGLVFVPVLLVRRLWLETAATLALWGLAALPYFLARPADLSTFITINVNAIPAPGWVVHAGNQGLHGLLTDLAARLWDISPARLASFGELPAVARVLLSLLPLSLVALALRVTLLPGVRSRTGLLMLLWSCVYLMGYKDVWEHSYDFVLPALAYAWIRDGDVIPRQWLLVSSIGLALPTAFILYDVALPPGPRDPERYFSLVTSIVHHATKPAFLGLAFVAALAAAYKVTGAARTGTQPKSSSSQTGPRRAERHEPS